MLTRGLCVLGVRGTGGCMAVGYGLSSSDQCGTWQCVLKLLPMTWLDFALTWPVSFVEHSKPFPHRTAAVRRQLPFLQWHISCALVIAFSLFVVCNIIRAANNKRRAVNYFGDGLAGWRVSCYRQAYVLPSGLQWFPLQSYLQIAPGVMSVEYNALWA